MTESATQPVTFISRFPNLRLVRIAQDVLRNEGGRKVGAIAPGSLHNERHGIEDDGSPWEVQFEGGTFQTDDPILIDFLRNHKPYDPSDDSGDRDVQAGGYGVDFFEQDAAPEEPKPTVAEQQERISRAAVRLDVAELQAVLNDEKATHDREAVVQGAEAALRAIAEGPTETGADADTQSGSPPSTSRN